MILNTFKCKRPFVLIFKHYSIILITLMRKHYLNITYNIDQDNFLNVYTYEKHN